MHTNQKFSVGNWVTKLPGNFVAWMQASFLLVALLAVLGHQTPVQATNLVLNGDFQTRAAGHTLATAGGYICQLGTTSCVSNVANWSSTCNGAPGALTCGTGGTVASILRNDTNGSAFNGNIGLRNTIANSPTGGRFIAIDGDNVYSASISQTLSGVTLGSTYILSFYQAAAQQNGTVGATTEWWEVSFGSHVWNSTGALGKMYNPNGGFTAWNQVSYTFTATAADVASPTLRFLAKSDNNNMGLPPVVLLDGVFLGTPEPGTFVLLGGGLVVLASIQKIQKKRKSTDQQP